MKFQYTSQILTSHETTKELRTIYSGILSSDLNYCGVFLSRKCALKDGREGYDARIERRYKVLSARIFRI
jgi:hypothetical protein